MIYLYLHGFASSPDSNKALLFRRVFDARGLPLLVPDLNYPSFERMTLSSQLACIHETLMPYAESVTIIGSSMGAILALLHAQGDPRVERLVVMAPAFEFLSRWRERLGLEGMERWRREGFMTVPHFGYKRDCRLSYDVIEDAPQWDDAPLHRVVPTLLFHGLHDDVVDHRSSVRFAQRCPWVTLRLLESDHGLLNVTETLLRESLEFLAL